MLFPVVGPKDLSSYSTCCFVVDCARLTLVTSLEFVQDHIADSQAVERSSVLIFPPTTVHVVAVWTTK